MGRAGGARFGQAELLLADWPIQGHRRDRDARARPPLPGHHVAPGQRPGRPSEALAGGVSTGSRLRLSARRRPHPPHPLERRRPATLPPPRAPRHPLPRPPPPPPPPAQTLIRPTTPPPHTTPLPA